MAGLRIMEQLKILLVSSDKNTSDDLHLKLSKLGCEVLGMVTSCDMVILTVERKNPNLIIIDAELEGSNVGIGIAKKIQKKSFIPIVFLITDKTNMKHIMNIDPFGCLKKPVDEQNLLFTMESVNKWLHLEQQVKEQAEKIKNQGVFVQTLIDALAHPFFIIDTKDYSIKLFNKAANISRSKKPSTCYKLTHGRSIPCKGRFHPCPLKEIKKTGKPFSTEHIHINKDGDTRNVEVHAFPIFNKNGNLVQMIESFFDITDRKRAEEKLIASEKIYKQLIQFSNDAIYLLYDRKFEIINKKYQEMFGVTLQDVNKPGFDFMELVAPKSRGFIEMRNQKLIKGEKLSRSYEFTALSKNGREIEVETSVSYIIYKKGIAVQGILRDITERKRAERELQKAHDELERRVEKRTAELKKTNMQLKKEVIKRKQIEVKIKHINAILSAIRNVNQLVVREKDRHQLIQKACNNLIETRGYFNAWIVLQDDSGKFTKIAGAGLGKQFSILTKHLKSGKFINCLEKVLSQSGCVVIKDPPSECIDCPMAMNYEGRGGISVRLEYKEKKYGFLSVSSPLHFIEEEQEQTLVEELANDIAFALHNIDVEEERRNAVEELKKQQERLEDLVKVRTKELVEKNKQLQNEIIERKQTEKALWMSVQKNEALLQANPDMMFVLSKDGNYIDFKADQDEYLAIPRNEIIGKNIREAGFSQDNIKLILKQIENALITRQIQTIEYKLETPKGLGFFEARLAPLSRDTILATVRNITERKKMEEELLKSEKLESLGLLASGIAHDFNNILAVIMANIGLLKLYANKNNKVFAVLSDSEKAISRAKDLTFQLLTFSKGGAPVKKSTSIDGMLKDTIDFTLSGSNVKCDYYIPDNLWDVEIDEGQVSQVIQNMIINAEQAMPEGGLVQIKAKNVIIKSTEGLPLEDGRYIRIEFQDQGTGISQDHLNKIFDPFFSTKDEGSGLGLSTAYSIIRNHNGLITVKSELDKGTTFYVYLPAAKKKTAKKKKQIQKMAKGQGKILLMDDEEMILEAIGELLRTIGYTVETAKDGDEVIKLHKESKRFDQPFDAIILDLTIPGAKGGKKTVQELLKIDQRVKVIASSGYSTDQIIANYQEYGFVGAISKPYNINELSSLLHKVIKSSGK